MLTVYPKGAPAAAGDEAGEWASVARFLDLVIFARGGRERPKVPDATAFSGRRASERFWILFGLGFIHALDQLCRHDFRHYYRAESGDRANVRGRIDVVRHRLNIVRGCGQRIPCRWEEFTPDHLDNRLIQSARDYVQRELRPVLSGDWGRKLSRAAPFFSEVETIAPIAAAFRSAKLRRLSPYYRETLDWAEWLVRGVQASSRTPAAQSMPPLVFDTEKLFEDFVQRIVEETARAKGRTVSIQKTLPLLLDPRVGGRPDAVIERSGDAPPMVIDAKYKRGIELSADEVAVEFLGAPGTVRISTSDLFQVYYYMRQLQSPQAILVMPFWDAAAEPVCVLRPGTYAKTPLDAGNGHPPPHVLSILGLNLMRPVPELFRAAREKLGQMIDSLGCHDGSRRED